MQVLVLFALAVTALAAPQGYNLPQPSSSFSHGSGGAVGGGIGSVGGSSFSAGGSVGGGSFSAGGGSFSSGAGSFSAGGAVGGGFGGDCGNGQVRHVDGSCVEPIVNRNIFVYAAPQRQVQRGPRPEIPKPKVNYNIVFVRTPEVSDQQEPIVIPPAREQTLVYVLSKNQELGSQVIEIPDQPPQTPEVYYVNYDDGENPQLPGGIDLQSALASANQQTGQGIGDGFAGGAVGGIAVGGRLSVGGGSVSGGAVGGGIAVGGGSVSGGAIGGGIAVGGGVSGGSGSGSIGGGVGQTFSAPAPSQTYLA